MIPEFIKRLADISGPEKGGGKGAKNNMSIFFIKINTNFHQRINYYTCKTFKLQLLIYKSYFFDKQTKQKIAELK